MPNPTPAANPENEHDVSSMVLRRALDGSQEALGHLVERFSPFLHFQARALCERGAPDLLDVDDLVLETWAKALPRLGDLEPRGGRLAPVLMRFLATTVVHLYNNWRRKSLRRRLRTGETEILQQVPDPSRGIITRAMAGEASRRVIDALRHLSPKEQEILRLVGLQQVPPNEVEASLGIKWESARRRYTRALEKLRGLLRSTVPELPDGM